MEFLHYMAIPSHITCYLLCHFDLFSSKPVYRKRKRPFHSVCFRGSRSMTERNIWSKLLFSSCNAIVPHSFFLTSLCWILEVQCWFGSGRLSLEIKRNVFLLNTQICEALAGFQVKFVPIRVQWFLFIEWSYSIPETNSLLPFIKKNDF